MKLFSCYQWIAIALLLFISNPILHAQYAGGTGDPDDPYLIAEPNHLQHLSSTSTDWDMHFQLTDDIDLTGVAMTPIGDPNVCFCGSFNGDGHTISNLTMDFPWRNRVGLFGSVGDPNDPSSSISNLGLLDPNIVGNTQVGCLVGYFYEGVISNCFSTGSVSGAGNVGGLVGKMLESSSLTNTYATVSVSGDSYVGGLVGHSRGYITNSYSVGFVSGNLDVGGLVGGGYYPIRTIASFWNIETSGQATSFGGNGKTNAEMRQISTYSSWVCDNAWRINQGVDTPRLVWENTPGTIIEPISFSGGSGRFNDPYLISTTQELVNLSMFQCLWSKHFKLVADIDLANVDISPIGNSIINFTGTFDGTGHTISNLSFDSSRGSNIGLFGTVGEPSDPDFFSISNLGLINTNINGYRSIGSLAGTSYGNIKNCYAIGSVRGFEHSGGLVGTSYGSITRCYAVGVVGPSGWPAYVFGGLVGYSDGSITSSYSMGSVNGYGAAGGLVGISQGSIKNCFSKASVSAWEVSGGFVTGFSGSISNCYSTGSVFALYDRNGFGFGRSEENCFWDIETSGITVSKSGIGLTTEELQAASTFLNAGWDFVGETANGTEDIWEICDATNYPKLVWQESLPGDISCPDGVDILDLSTLAEIWLMRQLDFDKDPYGGDGVVNMSDFVILASDDSPEITPFLSEWLQNGTSLPELTPNGGDGIFNMPDFAILSSNWLTE